MIHGAAKSQLVSLIPPSLVPDPLCLLSRRQFWLIVLYAFVLP